MGRAVRVDCRVRREAPLRSSSGSLSVWVLVLTLPVLGRRGRRRPRVGSCVPPDLDVVLDPLAPNKFSVSLPGDICSSISLIPSILVVGRLVTLIGLYIKKPVGFCQN